MSSPKKWARASTNAYSWWWIGPGGTSAKRSRSRKGYILSSYPPARRSSSQSGEVVAANQRGRGQRDLRRDRRDRGGADGAMRGPARSKRDHQGPHQLLL